MDRIAVPRSWWVRPSFPFRPGHLWRASASWWPGRAGCHRAVASGRRCAPASAPPKVSAPTDRPVSTWRPPTLRPPPPPRSAPTRWGTGTGWRAASSLVSKAAASWVSRASPGRVASGRPARPRPCRLCCAGCCCCCCWPPKNTYSSRGTDDGCVDNENAIVTVLQGRWHGVGDEVVMGIAEGRCVGREPTDKKETQWTTSSNRVEQR